MSLTPLQPSKKIEPSTAASPDPTFETSLNGMRFLVVPDPSLEVMALVAAGMARAVELIIHDPRIPEFTTRVISGSEPREYSVDMGFWTWRAFGEFKKAVTELAQTVLAEKQRAPELDLQQTFRGNLRYLENISMNNLEITIAQTLFLEHTLDRLLTPSWRAREGAISKIVAHDPRFGNACQHCINGRVGRDSTELKHAREIVRLMLSHMLESMVPETLRLLADKLNSPHPALPRPVKAACIGAPSKNSIQNLLPESRDS